jgi:hypothetical protein
MPVEYPQITVQVMVRVQHRTHTRHTCDHSNTEGITRVRQGLKDQDNAILKTRGCGGQRKD